MTDQDGLFDNPPPPILCGHENCKRPIAWRSVGSLGRWRWVHADDNTSQCFPSGTQWAKPADDQRCSRCEKPKPADWCWDGCRVMGECPLGYLARDIAESPQAVRELHERGPGIAIMTPQEYVERTPERRAAREEQMAHARRTDPVTSHEAAASIKSEALRRSQLGVISMFQRFGPMHDVALVERYMEHGEGLIQQSESGIRTRRSELVTQGLLEDSGSKALLPSGRRAIIWRMWRP